MAWCTNLGIGSKLVISGISWVLKYTCSRLWQNCQITRVFILRFFLYVLVSIFNPLIIFVSWCIVLRYVYKCFQAVLFSKLWNILGVGTVCGSWKQCCPHVFSTRSIVFLLVMAKQRFKTCPILKLTICMGRINIYFLQKCLAMLGSMTKHW